MTTQTAATRAEVLLETGRVPQAITILSTALASEPTSYTLLCLLARAHIANGTAVDAQRAAEAAIGANPEGEWAHRLLSLAYSHQHARSMAVNAARTAVRLAPTLWQTHTRLAMALADAGHNDEAWQAATEAVRIGPDQADTHFALGFIAMKSRARSSRRLAEREFETTVKLNPQHAAAFNNLAKLRLQRGRLAPAAQGFGAALGSDPQLVVAKHNLRVLARLYLRRFHWLLIIGYFVTIGISGGDGSSTARTNRSTLALGAGVVALLIAVGVVVMDRRLPANLRRYYRRLPLEDSWLGGWLAIDLLALLLLCCLPLLPNNAVTPLISLTWLTLLVARFVAARGAKHLRSERPIPYQ